MSTKTKTVRGQTQQKAAAGDSIWTKATTANYEWTDKDEFLDVVYWSRQVIGIIMGIIWGIFPLKGFIGLLLFAAINSAIVYVYAINFQGIDEEEYGGIWELIKEGFMTSCAGFLVTWIIFYTGLHFDSLITIKNI